jgi:glycosyltransferase involved in cell wall biosynthesis
VLRPLSRVPLHTSQIRAGTELPQMFQCFEHLSDTNVFVSYPHQHEDLLGLVRPEYLHGRQNIAHLAWEQKDANPWWRTIYGRYDEIWAISEFAARPFIKMFPGRVRVVPNVVDVDRFPNCDDAEAGRLFGDRLNFLFVFDANSSIERKNPEGLIDAFISAFEGTRHSERVRLTLKVGGMHRAEHAARVERLMRQVSRSKLAIQFDGRQLARDEMLRLIGHADCYVSLHRAEGFGYTMAEAMAYGVPVIASGYSGNLEYMTSESSFLVPCREAFVKVADGPFQRGSVWGEPDIGVAADLMRAVAERPTEAIEIGKRGRAVVRDRLSAKTVAEVIRPCLDPRGERSLRLAAD